ADVCRNHTASSIEGESVTLNCRFTLSYTYYVMKWYQQLSNRKMTEIIYLYSASTNTRTGRYSVSHQKGNKAVSLTITGLMPTDSGIYFCAHCVDRGSTLGKLYFGKGTQLTVRPAIQNPDPAVYQLKSPESSNISVCLFTDFDSEINVEPSTESNMTRLKSTSLDMKTMDSKSNGALAWSNSFDLGCNSTFNYTFHSSSGESSGKGSLEKCPVR
uniref:Ig-like domain-containing protein n=1 Tax=Panthera leo TaxID=9689 RepID=A0A8C8X3H7_PANLE